MIALEPAITSPGGLHGKESACNVEYLGSIHGWEDHLEKGMTTTPVFLPGEAPPSEEPGGLQPAESQRVWHNAATNTLLFTFSIKY